MSESKKVERDEEIEKIDAAILRHLLRSAERVKQIPFNQRTILSKQEAEEQRSIPWTEKLVQAVRESDSNKQDDQSVDILIFTHSFPFLSFRSKNWSLADSGLSFECDGKSGITSCPFIVSIELDKAPYYIVDSLRSVNPETAVVSFYHGNREEFRRCIKSYNYDVRNKLAYVLDINNKVHIISGKFVIQGV